MEPAKIAIFALIISIGSLIATVFNSVVTVKTYKKNTRLEFLQRRDRLSQQISNLNDRNTDFQLIIARYELVAVKKAGLPLQGEQAERNTALIASIKEQREIVEKLMKLWDGHIETLHLIYSHLTLETDAPEVEKMIAMVQVASDDIKKFTLGYSSTLHILETTHEFMKTTLAETDEKLRQINADFERAMERLTDKK